jgi:quercetin dioxygenase-like cupin family protein
MTTTSPGMTLLHREQIPISTFSRELIGAEHGDVPACVIFVDAAPGDSVRLHTHPYAELFLVLEGEATYRDGSGELVAQAGDVLIVQPGQPHGFANRSDRPLRQIDVHLSSRFETRWLEP